MWVRVQPAADPIAGLHDHALDPAVGQSIRDRQAGDPRTDDDHTLDRSRDPGGYVRLPVIETLTRQPGHPHRRTATCYRCIRGGRSASILDGHRGASRSPAVYGRTS
jgi:hypothetical protein